MYVYSAHQIPESVGDDNYNNAATSYPGGDNNDGKGTKIMQRWEQTNRQSVVFSPQAIQAVLDAYERTEPAASLTMDRLRELLSDHATKPQSLCKHPEFGTPTSKTVFWCVADVTDGRIRFGATEQIGNGQRVSTVRSNSDDAHPLTLQEAARFA